MDESDRSYEAGEERHPHRCRDGGVSTTVVLPGRVVEDGPGPPSHEPTQVSALIAAELECAANRPPISGRHGPCPRPNLRADAGQRAVRIQDELEEHGPSRLPNRRATESGRATACPGVAGDGSEVVQHRLDATARRCIVVAGRE